MSGSKIRLYGSTSGYVELEAPAVAPDASLVLPSTFGGIGSNVVQTVKTDTFTTSSTSYTDLTGLTVTITPSSATAKVLISWAVAVSNDNNSGSAHIVVTDGSDVVLVQGDAAGSRTRATAGSRAFGQNGLTIVYAGSYLWSPASASAVTAKVRIRATANTAVVNRSGVDTDDALSARSASMITAIEVAA